MPQIAPVPIDEPVARPRMSPAQAGSAGEAVAGLGAESAQLAISAENFEGYLLGAQRQLKAKQAEIAFDAAKTKLYDDLGKATTPEQAEAIYEHHRGNLDKTLAPFETDRVLARELGLYRQHEDNEIRRTVNAKKAHIVAEADHAANELLGQKSLQQAIGDTMGGGSPAIARTQFELQLESSINNGTLLPQQRDEMMHKWDVEYDKGVILAKINSPIPSVRQDTIEQLKKGGGGLTHDALNTEDIAQLHTHAVDTDHSLTQKEEAGSLNGALNAKAEAFSSPEFHNADGTPNYEAREKALENGEWLKEHSIVTPDGKPNYVMAEKLMEDDARQWQMHQKVQRDKDEEVLEKYSPLIYDPKHPLSIAQIEALPKTDGASSRAVNSLKTALFQEQRQARAMRNEERSLDLAERRQRREELEDRSIASSLALGERMAKGDPIDFNQDILTPISKGQMTETDGMKMWRMYKDSDQFPQIGEGIGIIQQAYKAMPSTIENNRKAADARDEFLKTVQDKKLHGADIMEEAQRIAEETGKAQSGNAISRFLDSLFPKVPTATADVPEPSIVPSHEQRPPGVPSDATFNPSTGTWQRRKPKP